MKTFQLLAAVLPILAAGCGDKSPESSPAPGGSESKPAAAASPATPATANDSDGTPAAAKALVEAFAKPGADTKALTAALKPDKADYAALFTPELAAKVEAAHAPMWATNPVIGPKPGQTEARIVAQVTTAEIKAWNKNASDNLPGGYEKIKDQFNDGFTVYKFDFVEPGKDAGMSFDILVHVNGKWRLFPKPWRAAQ